MSRSLWHRLRITKITDDCYVPTSSVVRRRLAWASVDDCQREIDWTPPHLPEPEAGERGSS